MGLCGKSSACFLIQLTRKSSLLRLCNMSSLQHMSSFLFISMTGRKVAQRIQAVVYSASWGKTCAGTICLHLKFEHNWLKWSCDKDDTQKDNGLEFKSLWLGFRIRAYVQGLGSSFRFKGSGFDPQFMLYKQEFANCLPAHKPWELLINAHDQSSPRTLIHAWDWAVTDVIVN